jgi:uncharacterized membrane protein HdeD (DUF308 family)
MISLSLAARRAIMKDILGESYWVLMLRGAIALLFGVFVLMWPGLTLLALVAMFTVYAVLGGVVSVLAALRHRDSADDWWLVLLLGLISIGIGVIAMLHPALTALVLVLVMGANALVTGVLDIAIAIQLRKAIHGEWMLIVSGLASIVFGVLVFLFPAAGALALVWLISLHAFVTGILLLALGARAQHWSAPAGSTKAA